MYCENIPYNVECEGTVEDFNHNIKVHLHIVYGSSGEYILEWDQDGNLVRDDRPWFMTA